MAIDLETRAVSLWDGAELVELERFKRTASGQLLDTRWETAECDDGTVYAALLPDEDYVVATSPLATITKDQDGYALFLGEGGTVATGRTLAELTAAFLASQAS